MNKHTNLPLPFSHLFSKMASLSVKPGQRFTLPDWKNNSLLISADAEQQRFNSHHIRQEGRVLRNDTGNQVSPLPGELLTALPRQLAEELGRVSRFGCMDGGIKVFTCTEHAKYGHLLPVNPPAMMYLCCH